MTFLPLFIYLSFLTFQLYKRRHDGPVWQVAWSHPKFGSLLASCSYDGKVLVWKDAGNGTFTILKEHKAHDSSVNSVSWGPHEQGLSLACASSDGKVSVITSKGNEEGLN